MQSHSLTHNPSFRANLTSTTYTQPSEITTMNFLHLILNVLMLLSFFIYTIRTDDRMTIARKNPQIVSIGQPVLNLCIRPSEVRVVLKILHHTNSRSSMIDQLFLSFLNIFFH